MPDLTDQMANAPTPAPWGVGAMGTTRMSMKPQLLAKLLQMKYAQQQDQEQEARAAMVRQQQMQDRMKEMQAQQLYGDKKMQAQQGFELMKMKMQQDAQQKAALLKTLIKQKADDQKKEQAKAMLAQMFGTPGAGFMARPPTQAPGIAEAQQGLAATQAAMSGMPGAQMAQQGVAGQQAQLAQMPQQRIIEDDEANNIFDAQKKAGVAPMLPPGFMLRSTLKDQQHQFNQQAAKAKIEQDRAAKADAEVQARNRGESLAASLLGDGATDEEKHRFLTAMSDPKAKPWQVAEKIINDRKAQAKTTTAGADKAELSTEKIVSEIEKAKIALARAKGKAGSISASDDEKAAAKEEIGVLESRIKRLEGKSMNRPAAPKATQQIPKLSPEILDAMKQERDAETDPKKKAQLDAIIAAQEK